MSPQRSWARRSKVPERERRRNQRRAVPDGGSRGAGAPRHILSEARREWRPPPDALATSGGVQSLLGLVGRARPAPTRHPSGTLRRAGNHAQAARGRQGSTWTTSKDVRYPPNAQNSRRSPHPSCYEAGSQNRAEFATNTKVRENHQGRGNPIYYTARLASLGTKLK